MRRRGCGWRTAYNEMLVCRNRLAKVGHQTKVTYESESEKMLIEELPLTEFPELDQSVIQFFD